MNGDDFEGGMVKLATYLSSSVKAFCVLALLAGCATPEQRRLEAALQNVTVDTLQPAGSSEAIERYLESARELNEAIEAHALRTTCDREGNLLRDGKCIDEEGNAFGGLAVVASSMAPANVVTNNQEQGVDEGDIVKKVGRFVIVLRQGHLYSIDVGESRSPRLTLVDVLEAVENSAAQDIWFDEILTFDGGLLLLGYNFGEQRSELMLFGLDERGQLHRGHRFQVTSADYYSTTNYGARVRGNEFVLSLTQFLVAAKDGLSWPQWRRVQDGDVKWQPLMDPSRLHLPLVIEDLPAVHTVLRCPIDRLVAGELVCATTGILGSHESELYVTSNNAYLTVEGWGPEAYDDMDCHWNYCQPSAQNEKYRYTALYRIARDGTVGVVRLPGTVADHFSFSETDGDIYVLTHHQDQREPVMLLQRASAFGSSLSTEAAVLARIPDADVLHQIRLTKTAAWIGELPRDVAPDGTRLLVQPFDGSKVHEQVLLHSVERIEPLDDRVLLMGEGVNGEWTATLVSAEAPFSSGLPLPIADYTSAEGRSHAFNADRRGEEWLFGLPGVSSAANADIVSDLIYFITDDLNMERAGVLDMQEFAPGSQAADSPAWYDWYGNARLFFVGERIFALSSSGLKEATYDRHGIRAVRSVRLEQ